MIRHVEGSTRLISPRVAEFNTSRPHRQIILVDWTSRGWRSIYNQFAQILLGAQAAVQHTTEYPCDGHVRCHPHPLGLYLHPLPASSQPARGLGVGGFICIGNFSTDSFQKIHMCSYQLCTTVWSIPCSRHRKTPSLHDVQG